MAVKQWGFVHNVRSTFDASLRSEFLIGYPFPFASAVIHIIYTDPSVPFFRQYMLDLSGIRSSGPVTPIIQTGPIDSSANYYRRYLALT